MRFLVWIIGILGLIMGILNLFDGLAVNPINIMQQNYSAIKQVAGIGGLMLFILSLMCERMLPPPPPQLPETPRKRFTVFDKNESS